MKLSKAGSSKDSRIQITKIVFLFLFAAVLMTTEIKAQDSINGDLPPAKTTGKSSVTTTTPAATPPGSRRQGNGTRRTRQQGTRRSGSVRSGVGGAAPTIITTPAPPPAPTPQPKITAPPAAPAPTPALPPAPPAQTPSEIIERYMDFQQSSSVTGKDWESVVKQTTATLQSDPEDGMAKAQLSIARGELAFNRADYSTALIQFNAAAQILPDSSLPFYGIGRVYLSTKQANQAETAFERSIKQNKNFALAYKGMGDALTAQRKGKEAEKYYKKAAIIGVAGNSSANDSGSGSSGSGNLFGGDSNSAAPTPQSESAYERDLKVAREYTKLKKWQMSLDKLEPLAASNPSADLYLAIGDNYVGMEAMLSAQQAYRKATETNPNSALAFYKSGMILYQMNEFQASAEAFEKCLILDQSGATINRSQARKWADRANEKVRDLNKSGKRKSFSGMLFN